MPFLLKVDRVTMSCSNCGPVPTSEDTLRQAAPKILDIALKLEMMSEVLQDLTLTLSHLKRSKTCEDRRCPHKDVTVNIIGGSVVMNGGQEIRKSGICWGSRHFPRKILVHKGCSSEGMKPRMAANGGLTFMTPLNRTRAAERVVPIQLPNIQHELEKVQHEAAKEQGDSDDAAAVDKEE